MCAKWVLMLAVMRLGAQVCREVKLKAVRDFDSDGAETIP